MKGIEFVTDDAGKRRAVLIDLRTHGELLEDVFDALTASARKREPMEPIAEVRRRLVKQHKLAG